MLVAEGRGRPSGLIGGLEIHTFATTVNSLLAQRAWLIAEQITLMVMKSTGDYRRGASDCWRTACT